MMTTTKRIATARRSPWLLGILLLAPIQLGAKGCGTGVVGNDGTGGGTSVATGGSANATGGSTGTGGTSTNPGKPCGGLAGVACATGEFCDYPPDAICGAADQMGNCKAVPSACTAIYAPVCGCDGKTYGSACEAAAKSVSVASQGECTPAQGNACGGLTGAPCGQDEFCNYPIDAVCGAFDQMGTCTVIPDVCDMIYAPVCGCDGKTYSSACVAQAAAVSVVSNGECAPSPSGATCGGIAALRCRSGEYCNMPPSAHCGAADQTGTCATIPVACTADNTPVCGCDGKTYANACSAAAAGVSVSSAGSCTTQ